MYDAKISEFWAILSGSMSLAYCTIDSYRVFPHHDQNPKDAFEKIELKTQLHEKLFFQWEIIEQSFLVTLKLLLFCKIWSVRVRPATLL